MRHLIRNTNIILISILLFCCRNQSHYSQVSVESENAQVDSCNDPDADIQCCFEHMPSDISYKMKIGLDNEEGERLIIKGQIVNEKLNKPYAGVSIYAYHTDENGYYSKSGNEKGVQRWHGKNHGWCKTDKNGKYEIHTIRPAPYPSNTMPAHIHLAIKLPDNKPPFYINDIVFQDDPHVNESYISNLPYSIGGDGVVELIKNRNIWSGYREIKL